MNNSVNTQPTTGIKTFALPRQENVLNFFRILAAVTALYFVFNFDLIKILNCSVLIVITYIPLILQKLFKIKFSFGSVLFFMVYAYGAIYMGSVLGAYRFTSWWDIAMHTLAGIVFIMFFLLASFYLSNKLGLKNIPLWVHFIIAFALTATIGMIWEIYEFTVDTFFGMNTQHTETGVVDTMEDILCNTFGSVVAGMLFYLSLARDKFLPLKKIFTDFFSLNDFDCFKR